LLAPARAAVSSALLGMVSGLWPIEWIILTAVFFYNLTVEAGQSGVVQSSLASLTRDHRLQALLIAFCFSGLLEGVSGEGAPVAVASSMLMSFGFSPVSAAVVCLVGNTPPVPLGPVGVPTDMPFHPIAEYLHSELTRSLGRLCLAVRTLISTSLTR
jgi:lactate permease